MRHSPTSFLATVAAGLLGCAVMAGCSTDNATEEEKAPSSEEQKGSNDAPSKKTDDKKEQLPPAFEPKFEPGTNTNSEGTDPTKDPAPANTGEQCIDNDDAGGSENVSKKLADTDDCDNDYKPVSGVMKGAVDVDFYSLSASDKFGCSVDADFQAETAGTELCVFMRCKNSTKDAVTGCEAGTEKTSEIGMKGCCAAAPNRALPTWDCSGITDNDSADVFIRVKQINADKCLPYKFKYRF